MEFDISISRIIAYIYPVRAMFLALDEGIARNHPWRGEKKRRHIKTTENMCHTAMTPMLIALFMIIMGFTLVNKRLKIMIFFWDIQIHAAFRSEARPCVYLILPSPPKNGSTPLLRCMSLQLWCGCSRGHSQSGMAQKCWTQYLQV